MLEHQSRLRGLSLEPTKIQIKKPKKEPNYINGERVDEVGE